MILDEATCAKTINGYTVDEWKPLLGLIPEIEATSEFQLEHPSTPFYVDAPVVTQFRKAVYGIPIMIGFDWPRWEEGKRIQKDADFDFDTIDLVKKCQFITMVVRADRFAEGALASTFKSGVMLKILKSIREEVESKASY